MLLNSSEVFPHPILPLNWTQVEYCYYFNAVGVLGQYYFRFLCSDSPRYLSCQIQKRSNYALWCWAIWLVTFGVFILTIEDTCWVFLSGIGGRTAINLCTLIWQNYTYCNRTLWCWRSVQMTFAILALTPKRSAPQLSPCRIDRLQVEFSVDWWESLSRVQLGGIKFELFAKKYTIDKRACYILETPWACTSFAQYLRCGWNSFKSARRVTAV